MLNQPDDTAFQFVPSPGAGEDVAMGDSGGAQAGSSSFGSGPEPGSKMFNIGAVPESSKHLHPSSSFQLQPRMPVSGSRSPRPAATPPRRRLGAPNSIPNFPSSTEHRETTSATGFTPSPSGSPGPGSPFKSPRTPNTPPNHASFKLPTTQAATPVASGSGSHASPWLTLAATSGALTPSLGGPGRSSPHLGGPFEQLNLNGSWSVENLRAEGFAFGSEDKKAGESIQARDNAAQAQGGGTGFIGANGDAPLDADMLAKYRSMAGRASATGGSVVSGAENVNSGAATSEATSSGTTANIKLNLPPALARRRASLPKTGLGIASPPGTSTAKSPSPLAVSAPVTSNSSANNSELKPLSVSSAPRLLAQTTTLILDVRPPSAYAMGHVPLAHSIPVPSTLLRRPAFTIAKVIQMLSAESQGAVQSWRDKANIILIDQDSGKADKGSLIDGLGSKFQREGFGGQLWFVRGGQAALEAADQVEMTEARSGSSSGGSATPSGQEPQANGGGQLSSGLGHFAFQQGSTGSGRERDPGGLGATPFTPSASAHADPFESLGARAGSAGSGDSASGSARDVPLSLKGMMMDSTSPSRASSIGSFGSSQSGGKSKLQPANPFFDNIRQNLELSHGGITERIPLSLPADAKRRAHELPEWLGELVMLSDKEVAERLAQQFYTVERNEQKRLQALMEWHSEGSGTVLPPTTSMDISQKGKEASWKEQKKRDQDDVERLALWRSGQGGMTGSSHEEYYPFSITAGVERGTKNRYKNIWPYDFSRVRLEAPCEDESDYINASYIQPRGTARRYIATQGPLDATYRDFWTLVWEQDVRVIVMLTKQFEGGQLKCGNYWQDQDYGPLHVHLEHQAGGEDAGRPAQPTGFDFGMPAQPSSSTVESGQKGGDSQNIRRDFYLSHADYPKEPRRKVVQLQCVAWPDFDVPDSRDVLLGLIKDVDNALREDERDSTRGDRVDDAPVLVHCSAGVGRTGSFIVVDSILDALTRERQQARRTEDEDVVAPVSISAARSIPAANTEEQSAARQSSDDSPLASQRPASSVDSSRSRGHSRREKSVTFAAGKPVVLNNTEQPESILNGNGEARSLASSPVDVPIHSTWRRSHHDMLENDPIAAQEESGRMDIDPAPFASPNTSSKHDPWLQYREDDRASDAETIVTDRRPSLASNYTSDERVPLYSSLPPVQEEPRPIGSSSSGDRERSPTPLSDMENPVLDVLESMRVQRMSLVQSLRQFVFVYKVIIHQYLAMLDEENGSGRVDSTFNTDRVGPKSTDPSTLPRISIPAPPTAATESGITGSASGTGSGGSGEDTDLPSSSTTAPTSVASLPNAHIGAGGGTGGGEDDTKPKRRASPTELMHDRALMAEIPTSGGTRIADPANGDPNAKASKAAADGGLLGRKASVKRIKQDRGDEAIVSE